MILKNLILGIGVTVAHEILTLVELGSNPTCPIWEKCITECKNLTHSLTCICRVASIGTGLVSKTSIREIDMSVRIAHTALFSHIVDNCSDGFIFGAMVQW